MIEDLVNIPVLGVMPYFQHNIEEEDSASEKSSSSFGNGAIKINVIKLPHMSNFNDLDPFKMYPECQLKFVTKVEDLENSDLIIIPGSKNSISDLNYLKNNGFFEKLEEERNKNTLILGICGGLQILGNEITDPYEIESSKNTEKGLGFLDISTILEKEKTTTQFFGKSIESIEVLDMKSNFEFSGYEIHQGVSKGKAKTFLKNESQDIGFVNGNVIGTYLHGVFEEGNFLKVILDYLKNENQSEKKSFKEFKEKEYNKLSRIARESLDMNKIYEIMGIKNESDL
jgi:adenosylcobyric acid synthase